MVTSLLPRNATAAERALELSCVLSSDVDDGIDAIRTVKDEAPDAWVPFLVWEYGLSPLVPFLAAERDALAAGITWQRMRGTPASLELALSLRGLTATIHEPSPTIAHWYDYQIDPGRVLAFGEHYWAIGLARASAPVGTILARVFHGHDVRDFVLDTSTLGDGILSGQSGVWDDARQCWMSFGRTHTTTVAIDTLIASGTHCRTLHSAVYRDDCLILGYSTLDDVADPTLTPAMHTRVATSSFAYIGTVTSGLPWQPHPWAVNGPQLHSQHYADHA